MYLSFVFALKIIVQCQILRRRPTNIYDKIREVLQRECGRRKKNKSVKLVILRKSNGTYEASEIRTVKLHNRKGKKYLENLKNECKAQF